MVAIMYLLPAQSGTFMGIAILAVSEGLLPLLASLVIAPLTIPALLNSVRKCNTPLRRWDPLIGVVAGATAAA